MHILLATDAEWIVDEITGALGDEGDTFTVCSDGRVVAQEVAARKPDLAICDLQIGSMGGMAVTMTLRLDESSGALPYVPVLMLLDRRADIHLARRSGAEGWMIKPLDSLRLRRACTALLAGDTYTEGVSTPDESETEPEADVSADAVESAEEEAATAG